MEILEFSRSLVTTTWEARSSGHPRKNDEQSQLEQGIPAWGLFDVLCKTNFHLLDIVEPKELLVPGRDGCGRCCQQVIDLAYTHTMISRPIYEKEFVCLQNWKKSMRGRGPITDKPADFPYTIAILKPGFFGVVDRQVDLFLKAKDVEVVERRQLVLSPDDIAFLYSTAYGKSFIEKQVDYYTSDRSEVMLLKGENIVNEQNRLKVEAREKLLVSDIRKNAIHFPDSLAESYAQIFYFFGESVLLDLIGSHYE